MFQNELKIAADLVNTVFNQSDYCDAIKPSYLREAVLSYPRNGGKRLRPAILLWFCQALGGSTDQSKHIASATELFHTWTLVHDDIIDQDISRRGQATAHVALSEVAQEQFGTETKQADHFGTSMAILTGDLLQSWTYHFLTEAKIPAKTLLTIFKRINDELYPLLLAGEALDVEFEHRALDDISEEEIIEMLSLKTGFLLQFSAETGALIALDSDYQNETVIEAGKFAMKAGLGFQICDDILGVYANHQDWGKPVGNDIRERKVTLLIKRTLELCSQEDHQYLLQELGNKDLSTDALEKIRQIIRQCGALEQITQLAEQYIEDSVKHLDCLEDGKYKDLLNEMAQFLIKREY